MPHLDRSPSGPGPAHPPLRARVLSQRRRRRIAFASTVVGALLVLELAGFLALRLLASRAPLLFAFDLEASLEALDERSLAAHRAGGPRDVVYLFDRALGWIRAPDRSVVRPHGPRITTDALGSRVTPGARGPLWIASYGDSFTEGLDVGDADTWQARLARRTGTRVLNFGVSGYGPDQALLLLERNLRDGIEAPVVVLAMIDENRNRLLGFVPRFYNQPAGPFMTFKPRFVRSAGGWSVQSFMPEDMGDVEAVRAAARTASLVDPFFGLRQHRIAFPYSLRAAAFLWRWGASPRTPWPGDREEAWAILEEIVRRFTALSRERDFVPVVALLPQSVEEIAEPDRPRQAHIAARIARPERTGLVYVDVGAELAGPRAEQIAPGFAPDTYLERRHPSSAGNGAIAAVLEDALRRAGAGPPGS